MGPVEFAKSAVWALIRYEFKTRPDTRLPQSRLGGQGLCLMSLVHLGRSSEAKDHKENKKVKCDRRTNGRTDKAGCSPVARD